MTPLSLVLRWKRHDLGLLRRNSRRRRRTVVVGMPEMIDKLREETGIPLHPRTPFRLHFSDEELPHAHRLEVGTEDGGGVWVNSRIFQMNGWCCSHIHDYFNPLLTHLYAKAESLP